MKMKAKSALLLAVVLLFLAGCGKSTTIDLSGVDADPNRFIWGSMSDLNVSLGDAGLFYCKNETLRYYDMEQKEEYILCGNANCRHNSNDCPAYFRNDIVGRSADNVAQVGNYIYCTYRAGNEIQLLRIDPSTGARKVVAAFPSASQVTADGPTFYASAISYVNYCNGYAWFMLTMQRYIEATESTESYNQITGVNLSTGEIIALNSNDGANYMFHSVCANSVYYAAIRELEEPLDPDEFYALAEDGVVSIDGMEFSSYSEYSIWHMREHAKEYAVYTYNIQTKEVKTLWQGTTVVIDEMQTVPYRVRGEYNGNMLWMEQTKDTAGNYTSHIALRLMDMSTGSDQVIFESECGGLLTIAQGYDGNYIFPDGTFFYGEILTEDTADIYVYDLNTGESTFLFTDDAAITFRIFGEYNGGFFGKHKDHQDDMRFYWISKEDFYAGNLDKAIMYQL